MEQENVNQQTSSQQSTSQPFDSISKPSQSKRMIPIIGILALLTLFGIGGYYLGSNKNRSTSQNYQPTTVISQSPSPTYSVSATNSPNYGNTTSVKIVDGDVVVTKDGKDTKITSWGYNSDPVLSPNGDTVAYISRSQESIASEKANQGFIDPSTNVWIINIDNKNSLQLTNYIEDIYRGHLHWIDNNRLLFTDGIQSAKVYTLNNKITQTVLGPEKPVEVCFDACGFDVRFFYNSDKSYLVRIEGSGAATTKIGILNTQTLKGSELIDQQFGLHIESVSFSSDNKFVNFKATKDAYGNQPSELQVSINLATQQVTTR